MAARKKSGKGGASSPVKSRKVTKKEKSPAKAKAAPKPNRAAKPVAKPATKPAPRPSQRKPAARAAKSFMRRGANAALRLAQRLKPSFARGPYDSELDRNPANYQPLTPLTFLERAASTFPDRTAIIHGNQRFTYAQFYARSRKLASALAKRGVRKGDTVAVMLSNTPPM